MNAKRILSALLGALWTLSLGMRAGNAWGDLATPVISEFLASNGSQTPLGAGDLLDADGDSSDWIELYNLTPGPFDLGGWHLTDDADKPDKWRFPSPTVLGPDGYLLVFASGKNRTAGELHTSFNLASESGYLALVMSDGRTVAYEYGPAYPPQLRNVSYGLPQGGAADAAPQYFASPTPGRANTSARLDIVAVPQFSHGHGLYDGSFPLSLSCDTPGATIRYTTDGQPPTETSGLVYTAPIVLHASTCVRAAAFKPGWRASQVHTRTFIFLAGVERQPAKPPGLPDAWGSTLADYEMDPEIVDSLAPQQLVRALRSLPTMSIVMKVEDLFGAAGIYPNWSRRGDLWERPCSVEFIPPDGGAGFQVNCGIRIYGGDGRREPKKSFRLRFTSDYGPSELHYPLFGAGAADRFDQLALRAGFNDAYAYLLGGAHAQYIRDEFARRLQLALGDPSPHGMFVHLYINGLYWGLYNPTERPNSSFAAMYGGGDKADWDVLHEGHPIGGSTMATWDAMLNAVRQGMMSNANYQRLQGNDPDGSRNPQYVNYLDLDNYIHYLLVNFFVGNRDWPLSNWYAGINRVAPAGWKSFSWDTEHSMGIDSALTDNVTDIRDSLGEPYAWLRINPDFCLRFADRAYRAFFNGGPLCVEAAPPGFDREHPERNRPAALYAALADVIEAAMPAESARWGDIKGTGPFRIDQWRQERDWLLSTYLAQRSALVLSQLRGAGLYPTIDAPSFQVNGAPPQGGTVSSGSLLTMTASTGAAIYYTTDGSDPRIPGFASGDHQMVTLVPADAPKRVLVPSVANGGNLLKDFSGGFDVTCYQAKGTVDSLTAAEAVISNASLRTSTAQERARVINYGSTGHPGYFNADRLFPGTTEVEVDDFVIVATGKVMVPAAGNWTFGVGGDGGFKLSLSRRGKAYTNSSPGPRSAGDALAVFSIAESGLYDLRLVFYHGAGLELFAAPGSFTSFSATAFRLVGDILKDSQPLSDGTLWIANSFDDSSWRLGTGGVGFARDSGYETLLQIDVGTEMYQATGSCYVRIPFTVAGASYASLAFRVRYDDGFIAYLNGTEVARRNFVGDPQWNSVANGAHSVEVAQTAESVDISDFIGLLRPGINLLVLHGLNAAIDSSSFLISVELVGGELGRGSIAPTAVAYTGPMPLQQSLHLKARAFDGKWSALNETVLAVGPVAQSLRVSELMYHPLDTGNPNDPNTEFIELTNVAGQNINLNLVQLTEGIHYTFPGYDLPAGRYCLVVKDLAAFQAKYGATLPVVGQYTGSLDNRGERIELVDAVGEIIQSFEYDDDWFKTTDGLGYSLTVKDPTITDTNSLNDKNAWRPSTSRGGSPGANDPG